MAAGVYYIPDGPKNLTSLFPAINFNQVATYYVEVLAGATVIATSPVYNNQNCNCDDEVRVHFRNYPGAVDAQSFRITSVDHETKSDTYESASKFPLVMQDHGLNKINVKANDTYTVYCITDKDKKDYFKELLDTTAAWLEWDGSQGLSDDYIPIVISDQSVQTDKDVDQFMYKVVFKFKLSHETNVQRN